MVARRIVVGLVVVLALVARSPASWADPPSAAATDARALETALALEDALVALVDRVRPAYVMIGGGSGVLISADGYMLTNNHVVGTTRTFQVMLPSLARYKASIVATDQLGDLALLKLEGAKDLPFLELGDSDALAVGQRVLAIGNPWMAGRMDAQPTVTWGVVSAINVFRGNYSDAIQTDAPVNPGNSGGPLITSDGRLVGINGQVRVRFGTDRINTGIAYAISATQIRRFLGPMKAANGKDVGHGTLFGVAISGEYFDAQGARVERVSATSPAFNAGLRPGDFVVAIDGLPVWGPSRLAGIVGTYPAGSTLNLKLRRGAEEFEVAVPIGARAIAPAAAPADPNAPFLGVQLDQSHAGPGVLVAQAVPGGSAEKAGVKDGDVILAIDGREISAAAELQAVIATKRVGDKVALRVKRDLDELAIEVQLGRRGGN